MRARLVAVTLLTLALQALLPMHQAAADDGGGAFVDDNGDPTATANDGDSSGGGSAGGGSNDGCPWIVLIDDDFEWALYDRDGTRRFSETGRWFAEDCPLNAQGSVGGIVIIPEGNEVDPEALALDALATASIDQPPISTSPPADRRLYTQVPTWLWLDGDWWQGYAATASAGRVTSTVTATPVATDWEPGDGDQLTCRGPGVEWRRGLPDSATYCSHTYRHSSANRDGDAFTLGVTVRFEVTWTSNTGQGGALQVITRSASRSVQVGEIQAVETE